MSNGIGKEFMEKTKYKNPAESDQSKGLPQPPLELEYDDTAVLINLPPVENINVKNVDLRVAIESRKTVRKYAETSLSVEEISYLLWCTQGVKKVVSRPATMRTIPSAGARHAFETYLLINKVDGIKPGLYRYIALSHKLMEINTDSKIGQNISDCFLRQELILNSAVTFIWSADAYRMKWRYGERGYRYMHLDAGHVCQNLYLAAQNVESGVCAIASFYDDKINNLLTLDGENQFVVYVATVGKNII